MSLTEIEIEADRRARAQLLKKVNRWVAGVGFATNELARIRAERAAKIAALEAEYEAIERNLVGRQQRALNKIQGLVQDKAQWRLVKGDEGKTLSLRSGALQLRTSTTLEVTDKAAFFGWLRRRGWLGRYTTQPERVPNKDKIKSEWNTLAKASGVELVESENLRVVPVNLTAAGRKDPSLRRVLPSGSS